MPGKVRPPWLVAFSVLACSTLVASFDFDRWPSLNGCRSYLEVMTQPKPQIETELAGWRAGQRVSRKDTEELGTIVEANGKIKVKWDGGRTLTGF